MIIQRFNLNLIPNQSPVIVHVNQYDTGAGRLIATLYEGNEPYSPNGTAVIQGTKPDGHGFQYTATLDGNVVTADLTEQMSPVAGDVRAQIVVTESSGVTGTFVFIMRVQPSALPSDADMSESDYPLIEEAIREAQEAVTATRDNAENSEAWAQGTRGGIPVEPTDPTYEHNAEYWAQYAERYAQGGLHYKASIPFADIPTTGMREGDMYDITDDFTTDSRFTEGAGIKVKGGTNIAWNSDNKWDILALPYIPKTTFNGRSGSILPMAGDYDSEKILLASALHIGGETQDNVQKALEALEGNKADKVDNAVADNFAGLDADGNLKDSGKKVSDFATPSDIAGQQSLLKDTVGWSGKNKCETIPAFTLVKGSERTKNNTIKDTPNYGTYKVSFTISNVANITKQGGIQIGDSTGNWSKSTDGVFDVVNGRVLLTIPFAHAVARVYVYLNGNDGDTATATFSDFMITDTDILDDTYEPYHESVQNQLNAQGVLGAKNLLPYPYTETTLTRNGITFTVNSDGTVTVNGTATAEALFTLHRYLIDIKLSGNFILNGCPTGGTNTTYQIYLQRRNAENTGWDNPIYRDFGDGVNVTIENGRLFDVNILIRNGSTLNNLVFKPMLRLASDPDDTYQPYAMTNRELTEKKINIADLKTVVSASSDFADFKTRIASL